MSRGPSKTPGGGDASNLMKSKIVAEAKAVSSKVRTSVTPRRKVHIGGKTAASPVQTSSSKPPTTPQRLATAAAVKAGSPASTPAPASAKRGDAYVHVEPTTSTRHEIISAIFERCMATRKVANAREHKNRVGRLGPSELLCYAEALGFKGTQLEWAAEYRELCADAGGDPECGLDLQMFEGLCNNRTSVLHCDDDKLRWCLTKIQRASEVMRFLMPLSRPELIRVVFRVFCPEGQQTMDSRHLRLFAEMCGFEGDDTRWKTEYEALCAEHGWDSATGPDLRQIAELVNDDSGRTYQEDEFLREILDNCGTTVAELHELLPYQEYSRDTLIIKLFHACEPHYLLQRLGMDGMRNFAELMGYNGNEEDWTAEYLAQCADCGYDEKRGASLDEFRDFVSDPHGQCYCDGRQLRKNLAALVLRGKVDEKVLTQEDYVPDETVRGRQASRPGSPRLKTADRQQDGSPTRQREKADARIEQLVKRSAIIGEFHDDDIQGDDRDVSVRTTEGGYFKEIELQMTKVREPEEKMFYPGRMTLELTQVHKEALQRKRPEIESSNYDRMYSQVKGLNKKSRSQNSLPSSALDGVIPIKSKRHKPLTETNAIKVIRTIRSFSGHAPQGDALLSVLGKEAVGGMITDVKLVKLLRKLWKVPSWELTDEVIYSLFAYFDKIQMGQIELRGFVESINGMLLSAEQAVKLVGKGNEGQSSCGDLEHSQDEESARSLLSASDGLNHSILPSRQGLKIYFDDAPLPEPGEVTRTFLSNNPSFIIKVIKARAVELCLMVIERLDSRGINQTDLRGCTALHMAAEADLGEVCAALLNRGSFIGPVARDYQGWSALHRGARNGSVEACRALLLHPRFADVNRPSERDGWNALHFAAMHGHIMVVQLLLADSRFTGTATTDKWGRTPLLAAAERGHLKVCEEIALCDRLSTKQFLLANKWAQTPLTIAKGGPHGPIGSMLRSVLRAREYADAQNKT